MLRQLPSLFNLASGLVVIGVLVADALMYQYWHHFKRVLGGALGAELGLLIFLHFLAGLFVIESFERRLHGSRWFRWYFRLPAGEDGRARSAARGGLVPWAWLSRQVPTPVIKLGVFTALFYSLETFLLPFLPVHLNIQAEILVIALILAWHTLPFRGEVESGVARAPGDFELG